MPFVPSSVTAGQNPLVQFGGLVTTEFVEPSPGCAFQIRQIYKLRPPDGASSEDVQNTYRGPPLHFHAYQTERFMVEKGRMGIEVNGKGKIVTPEDGVIVGPAGSLHRFWVAEDSVEDMIIVLNATDAAIDYQLDRMFFENWYGFREDSLAQGKGMDVIQMLSLFDAGDHYIPAPEWVPFRALVGFWITIVVGRWIGGLLGYKPFFREYTTDWEYAVEKMRGSFFQRHLVESSYRSASSFDKLKMLQKRSEELNPVVNGAGIGGQVSKIKQVD